MFTDFNLREAVTSRYSVRTYEKKKVEKETRDKLLAYVSAKGNPFGPDIRVQFIEKETAANGEKLGTYGVIKGAKLYIGVTVADKPFAAEAVGYEFERLVLYAASLGLGTCWLGGTFNRSAFTEAMEIKEGELFPILSPLGYPSDKKSLTEKLMRRSIKADDRLPWSELFFTGDFDTPITEEYSGIYSFPLEMLRLAPSAVNKQPWRVLICDDAVHFFKKGGMVSELGSLDMQRIDLGIAMCHFDLAAQDIGLSGHFEIKNPYINAPGLQYIASWLHE